MNVLASMPASGIIVIAAIAILFVLAVLLLFYTWGRYKGLAGMVRGGLDRNNGFLRFTVNDFPTPIRNTGRMSTPPRSSRTPSAPSSRGSCCASAFLQTPCRCSSRSACSVPSSA